MGQMIDMLKLLGLGHVPVKVAGSYIAKEGEKSASDHLADLYDTVSPAGVSLVVEGALGAVSDFASGHPALFKHHTRSVVLMGGAFPSAETLPDGSPSGQTILLPDVAAQNNAQDLPAAKRFFQQAQELLVPLVVISRHCAGAVQVTRELFDNLAEYGGVVGKKLKEVQMSCIMQLWTAASTSPSAATGRMGLPDRCDQKWFADTFCAGKQPNVEDGEKGVWEAVQSFRVYALLQVLITLPPFMNQHVQCGITSVTVRSVQHRIIGLTKEDHGICDPDAVKELIFQSLFFGAWL